MLSGKGRLKPEDGHLLGELTPSIARLPEHSAGTVHGRRAHGTGVLRAAKAARNFSATGSLWRGESDRRARPCR